MKWNKNNVSVLLNKGNIPYSVAASDFNNDTLLDIALQRIIVWTV